MKHSSKHKSGAELIPPYGGTLVNLLVPDGPQREELLQRAQSLPSLRLSTRTTQDLELLATGAFSPLSSFMTEADYHGVLERMRLADGTLFPIPLTLPIHNREEALVGKTIALRDLRNDIIGIMTIEEIFRKNLKREAISVYGTLDTVHPLVSEMLGWGDYYISGPLRVLNLPKHYAWPQLHNPPARLRRILASLGNPIVVAFQTRNPMHRVHEELTKRAATATGGTLLLHPAVGVTRAEDIPQATRIRTYIAMHSAYFPSATSVLSLLPLAMRFAGPREALWHALIRRNYGASHFIIGRNHASPGLDARGHEFYAPDAALRLASAASKDIGVTIVPFEKLVYSPKKRAYIEQSRLGKRSTFFSLSGTDIRNIYLRYGKQLPAWFTRSEVAAILAEEFIPKHKRGFCLWFTGLPAAGKSTIASYVNSFLQEAGRTVTMLDGDIVRTHLSRGLGYSKADRDVNVLRIGFVASEIVKHNGAVICAAVSPYEATRNRVRNLMPEGTFILIHVDTPLALCKKRDIKGMYKKAARGEIRDFTGINDPYERPKHPALRLTTSGIPPGQNAGKIVRFLEKSGFIKSSLPLR